VSTPRGKILYLLIGPKGSGKTYIGATLERLLGVCFISVEQRLINHLQTVPTEENCLPNDGYDLEAEWIEVAFQTAEEVISEATGSSKYLPTFLSQLAEKYELRLVRVACPMDICLERIRTRGTSGQFYVSEDKVTSINEATRDVKLDWCLEIDNSAPASNDEIVALFNSIRPERYA
jgi:predicted ABC-type ATPase